MTEYSNTAAIADAMALAEQLAPAFQAKLATMTLTEIKALCKQERIVTRGCTVRQHFADKLVQRWTQEVWDEAGYRIHPHPGYRVTSRSLMTLGGWTK
jgi:hypothetical protein